ncbi:MAG: nitroreductase [Clostridia bacterium]|nr:nitroreductase [Clostridia bacterium]
MDLKELIYKRKSTRSYKNEAVDAVTLNKISDFASKMKALYPDIRVKWEFADRDGIRCMLPWTTPQNIVIWSEDKDGAYENVGFLFQQMDLYLQSLGLGACWLGMGRPNGKATGEDGLKFMIVLAFGIPKEDPHRKDISEFSRKPMADISDVEDERLEVARLAPSSVNSQPWYFTHDGDRIHVYCAHGGIFRGKGLALMNKIDMGIALAHIYVANPETFEFFDAEADEIKDRYYIGSIKI